MVFSCRWFIFKCGFDIDLRKLVGSAHWIPTCVSGKISFVIVNFEGMFVFVINRWMRCSFLISMLSLFDVLFCNISKRGRYELLINLMLLVDVWLLMNHMWLSLVNVWSGFAVFYVIGSCSEFIFSVTDLVKRVWDIVNEIWSDDSMISFVFVNCFWNVFAYVWIYVYCMFTCFVSLLSWNILSTDKLFFLFCFAFKIWCCIFRNIFFFVFWKDSKANSCCFQILMGLLFLDEFEISRIRFFVYFTLVFNIEFEKIITILVVIFFFFK